jgi:hypothetical protein
VFVAERLDHAVTSGAPIALDEWFEEGALTASREVVEGAIGRAVTAASGA